jgi:hypothetical protein
MIVCLCYVTGLVPASGQMQTPVPYHPTPQITSMTKRQLAGSISNQVKVNEEAVFSKNFSQFALLCILSKPFNWMCFLPFVKSCIIIRWHKVYSVSS